MEIGDVSDITLTRDGQAEVTLQITDEDYAPLREGTLATVRQASLSGVANRYIDLRLPGGDAPEIADGGTIRQTDTTTAVDLDQLFNTFDPEAREALQASSRASAAPTRAAAPSRTAACSTSTRRWPRPAACSPSSTATRSSSSASSSPPPSS